MDARLIHSIVDGKKHKPLRCDVWGERLMHTLDREGDEYEEMVNVRIKW